MGDYNDYPDDDYNGDGGYDEDGDRYGLEREANERMNVAEVDRRNPKDNFNYLIAENYDLFNLTEKDFHNIREKVAYFSDIEYQNYNAEGILAGYAAYKKGGMKNKKKFDELYNEISKKLELSKCDLLRYARLWKLYLSK